MLQIKPNLEQCFFILAVIFLPLNQFPVIFPIIGNVISKLFVFLGISIYIYKTVSKKSILDNFEKFALYYLAVFLLWRCICTVIGVLEHNYYDLIFLEQMDKLRYLLQNLRQISINIHELTAIKVWLGMRLVKECFLSVFFTYGVSVWIYHMYKDYKTPSEKCKAVLSHVTLAVSVLCVLLIGYSVFEVGYLRGSKFCADILTVINPLLHDIGGSHGWWPDLLLPGRLRSLFAEPSFFGVVSVIICCVLFYKNLTTKKLFYSLLLSVFVMMTVMTRSRTAIPLFAGQFFLLLIYVFSMDRKYIKETVKILLIVILSLFAGLYLMAGFKPVAKTVAATVKPNEKTTATSTKKPDSKSNPKEASFDVKKEADAFAKHIVPFTDKSKLSSDMSRLNSTKAYFLTGLQNPVFGVGKGLSNAYADANYLKEDVWRENLWSTYIRKKGVFKSLIPVLNHWSNEVAEFGVTGLLIFLLPVFYILHNLTKIFPQGIDVETACVAISYLGSNVAMLNGEAFLTYYILTGMLLVLLRCKTERQA